MCSFHLRFKSDVLTMGPKRKKQIPFNFELDQTNNNLFWSKLQRKSIYSKFKKFDHSNLMASRAKYRMKKITEFRTNFKRKKKSGSRERLQNIVSSLKHWIQYSSWTYCSKCQVLSTSTLLPKSLRNKGCCSSPLSKCWCSRKYIIPSIKKIPSVFRKLSKDDEQLLSIFEMDIGPKQFAKAGHRIKTGAFELRIRLDTVCDRISGVKHKSRKARLNEAYLYLSESSNSHYRKFLPSKNNYHLDLKLNFGL